MGGLHPWLSLIAVVAANVAVPLATTPPSFGAPEQRSFVEPLRSSNWSGYAVIGGGFTSVTGRWVVPTLTPSRSNTYSSSWVGIGGLFNSTMIQAGTEQDFVDGAAGYHVWWEILPAAQTAIPERTVKVRAGDAMTASISLPCGSAQWTITITDVTRNQSFTTRQAYNGQRTSAEWIEEATLVDGHIARLAHIGTAAFGPGTVDGADPAVVAGDGGVMVQLSDPESTPSPPDSDMDGFTVQYGSATPVAPSS
jgi:hypothetical protein